MSIFEQFSGAEVNLNITFPTMQEVQVACRHVLFVLDDDHTHGVQPGGFVTSLIELTTHADQENLAKLSLGFPAIATAVDMYKNKPGGVDVLRRLASQAPDVQPDDGFSPKGN